MLNWLRHKPQSEKPRRLKVPTQPHTASWLTSLKPYGNTSLPTFLIPSTTTVPQCQQDLWIAALPTRRTDCAAKCRGNLRGRSLKVNPLACQTLPLQLHQCCRFSHSRLSSVCQVVVPEVPTNKRGFSNCCTWHLRNILLYKAHRS